MADDGGGRRYDEEEVARILRKASELQERGRPGGRPGALALEEIKEIAAEVGIDPEHVERAAVALPVRPDGPMNPLLGATSTWRVESSVEGEIDEEGMGRAVDTIRAVFGKPGEVESLFGGVEWSHDDELGPIHVRVGPRDGRTRVEVHVDRAGEAGLWFGLSPIVGFLVGAILVGILGVATTPAKLAAIGAGLLAALVGARGLWIHRSRVWRERVERNLEQVVDRVAGLVPAGDGDDEEEA